MKSPWNFGIEIELSGIPQYFACGAMSYALNKPREKRFKKNGDFDCYAVVDEKGRSWEIHSDRSVQIKRICKSGAPDDDYRVEFVTPRITWEDLESVCRILYFFEDSGGIVTKSCGLHLHVDVGDFDASDIRRLCRYYFYHEPMLLKILNVHNERVKYCLPMSEELVTRIGDRRHPTLGDLRLDWYGTYRDENDPLGKTRYHRSRYHGLNLHSLWKGRGIEFRAFNSTLDGKLVLSYVTLILCMLDKVKGIRSCRWSNRNEFPDNKAIRRWLNQLGISSTENAVAWNNLTAALG